MTPTPASPDRPDCTSLGGARDSVGLMSLRGRWLAVPRAQALWLAVALFVAAVVAIVGKPQLSSMPAAPPLGNVIPERFGDWRVVQLSHAGADIVPAAEGTRGAEQPYDDVLMRAYGNSRGEIIILAVAYSRTQKQDIKVHRPELCYVAAGFQVLTMEPARFGAMAGATSPVAGKRMLAQAPGQLEAVAYWIRIGALYSESAVDTRRHILLEGLRGRVPDGVLVRASRVIAHPADAAAAYPSLERFLEELTAAVAPSRRSVLVQ